MSQVLPARGPTSRKSPQIPTLQQLPDPHVGKDGFLDLFGRPLAESACECERRADLSLPQALNLINGKTISDAVADPNGRVTKAVLAGKSESGDRRRAVSRDALSACPQRRKRRAA